jgi:hypothetical protein
MAGGLRQGRELRARSCDAAGEALSGVRRLPRTRLFGLVDLLRAVRAEGLRSLINFSWRWAGSNETSAVLNRFSTGPLRGFGLTERIILFRAA